MNSSLRSSAAHVFVESLDDPVLAEVDVHHLVRVLRLRDGESVSASDGLGSWRMCRFVTGAGLSPAGDIATEPVAEPQITIGFALPKADRPEWIVQKLVEIGVDRIVILHAERSVVRWDTERAQRHLAKFDRIAREAAMQSRRVRLASLEGPTEVMSLASAGVAVAEPGGIPVQISNPTILIGPEGGWSGPELAAFTTQVDLGPGILRVETAALVAAARLVALSG